MASSDSLFAQTLKSHGYSMTKVRQRVFDALENAEPQSMKELLQKVHKIDRASVYRTIALFEELGIVHRIQIGWKYRLELSETFNYHHHHIHCTQCDAIVPIHENITIEAAIRAISAEYGFRPTTHQLEIQGVCSACQKKDPGISDQGHNEASRFRF